MDLEALGARLFSWTAGLALLIGAIFFLKLAVDYGWLVPPLRMALGLATGAGLLVLCELRIARRYAVTANALLAAGLGILFATLFASHALWHLITQLPTFVLMALVTAVAVLLSLRHDSLFIALLGLLGGFGTPALLGAGEDHPIGRFGYLLLLNVGLAWVAHRKRWPALHLISIGLTFLYQWAWVIRFLDTARIGLAMAIFLAFPIAAVVMLTLGDRLRSGAAESPLMRFGTLASAALPLLLALYLAAVRRYGGAWELQLGFVLLMSAGLFALSLGHREEGLHLLGGFTALAVIALHFATSYRGAEYPRILGFMAALVMFYTAAPWIAGQLGRPFTGAGKLGTALGALLFIGFPALLAVEEATVAPALPFSVLLGLVLVLAARHILAGEAVAHRIAALLAIVAQAVWSARFLDGDRLLPALAIYAAFALVDLATPILADRRGVAARGTGLGAAFTAFAAFGVLLFLAAGATAPHALPGLALLLLLLNLGLLAQAASGRLSAVPLVGLILSFGLLLVWAMAAPVSAPTLLGLLAVVSLLAMVATGGTLLAAGARERSTGSAGALVVGPFFGLAGHAFLLFVVLQRSLAADPWPWLAVLLLLDLALAAAALAARQVLLHTGAMVATQLLVLLWAYTMGDTWASTQSLWMAAAGVGLCLALEPLGRRRGLSSMELSSTSVACVFFAQFTTTVLSLPPTNADDWAVGVTHVGIVVLLLAVAMRKSWHELAPAAVLTSAFATLVYEGAHEDDATRLIFYGAIYGAFQAYPHLLGARAGRLLSPYLGAVLASVPFFLLGRECFESSGMGPYIGILPVAQAAIAMLLVLRLLSIEPPGQRYVGRLALTAGTALAFVTVAIPLQLDKEWITIGWALEAAALAWLYRRLDHRGLLHASWLLAAAVMVRLCLNPAVVSYHPRAATPILNWYLYTYLVAAAALYLQAWFLKGSRDDVASWLPDRARLSRLLPAGATLLLFLLLNIEIADFWSLPGQTLTFDFDAGLKQGLSYTIGWAMFAVGLLLAGIYFESRPTRLTSLLLLAVTALKGFLHDMRQLSDLYRVASFVGLAIALAVVALLLQKFVLRREEKAS